MPNTPKRQHILSQPVGFMGETNNTAVSVSQEPWGEVEDDGFITVYPPLKENDDD